MRGELKTMILRRHQERDECWPYNEPCCDNCGCWRATYTASFTPHDLVIARGLVGSTIERVAEVIAAVREEGRREVLRRWMLERDEHDR